MSTASEIIAQTDTHTHTHMTKTLPLPHMQEVTSMTISTIGITYRKYNNHYDNK